MCCDAKDLTYRDLSLLFMNEKKEVGENWYGITIAEMYF
jgi:hypothetical protein